MVTQALAFFKKYFAVNFVTPRLLVFLVRLSLSFYFEGVDDQCLNVIFLGRQIFGSFLSAFKIQHSDTDPKKQFTPLGSFQGVNAHPRYPVVAFVTPQLGPRGQPGGPLSAVKRVGYVPYNTDRRTLRIFRQDTGGANKGHTKEFRSSPHHNLPKVFSRGKVRLNGNQSIPQALLLPVPSLTLRRRPTRHGACALVAHSFP